MSNRIYFDQDVIQTDFSSFTYEDLFGSKSIIGSIVSLFRNETQISFNSAFSFACNATGERAAVVVGQYLYYIALKTKQIKFAQIPAIYTNFKCSVAFSPSTDQVVVLSKTKLYYFNDNLELQSTTTLKYKCIKLLAAFSALYAITSSSIISINDETVFIPKIDEWLFSLSTKEYIILIHSNSMTIIQSNKTILKPEVSFTNPIDAVLSPDEKSIFILDPNQQIYVHSAENGFSILDKIDANNAIAISPWGNDHIATIDEFGSLIFITLSNHQFQQQSITAKSVIRGTPDGFLLFQPQDQSGESIHFDLIHFISVSPYELYERNCAQGFFGDAILLLRTFNFDSDVYYKAYISQNDLTPRLIDDHLRKIKDAEFIYEFCTSSRGDSPEIINKLYQVGLDIRPDDPILLKYRERLHIFIKLSREGFVPAEWNRFKTCDLYKELTTWAKKSIFNKMAIVFKETTEIDETQKYEILSCISPFVPPNSYREVMPRDANWYRERAIQIDNITGQTSIIVELMKIGSRILPALKTDMEYAVEFDNYVTVYAEDNVFSEISFYQYLGFNDEKRLALFGYNRSGKSFSKILAKEALTIVERNPQSLKEILSHSLTQDKGDLFQKYPLEKRFSHISAVLKNQTPQVAKSFVNDVITKIQKPFTTVLIDEIIDSWKQYLSTGNNCLLDFQKYFNIFEKPISFADFVNLLSCNFVLKIAKSFTSQSYQSWSAIFDLSKKINNLFLKDEHFINELDDLHLIAMIRLKQWDKISITSTKQRDIALSTVEELLSAANTCLITDPSLSSALRCLGMIPVDMNNQRCKVLFQNFRLYRLVSEIDQSISPSQVHQYSDITSLIIGIIEKKKSPFDISAFYKSIKQACIQLDGVELPKIHQAFVMICLRDDQIEFGSQFLLDCDDQLRLKYLNSTEWKETQKKIEICNDSILRCDPDLLAQFVDIRSSFTCQDIFGFLSKTTNDSIIQFIFTFLNKMNLYDDLKEYGEKNLVNYIHVIEKLDKYKFFDDEQYDKFNNLVNIFISESNDQMKALKQAEEIGFDVDKKMKCIIVSQYMLKKWKIDSVAYAIPDMIQAWKDNKRPDKDLITLLGVWHDSGALTENIIVDAAGLVSSRTLVERREFWAKISDESTELAILQSTKNIEFGLSSKYEALVEKTNIVIRDLDKISASIIDQIIENKQTYLYANSKHFQEIIARAKSLTQLQQIFESLINHNEEKAILEFITQYFCIPMQYASPSNSSQLIKIAKDMLRIK